MLFFATNSL